VSEEGKDRRRSKELEAESATLKEELTAVELELSILFVPINKELKRLKKQDETGKFTFSQKIGERSRQSYQPGFKRLVKISTILSAL